ncbi:ABL016Cp [Eremothecium gossypii ATCC 10895]|uniref:ABL016Cp n=1 Tax=Eremothecium gossypii (strain ATCC 10895 / CBS 109.51 / FGSC 9923 / NRRL Y-1056) TaxID=284811 RepID=Q75DN3_EREGS|nr:ABL016Cp [Eremothecium gossypii ATCC 10895]AAS50755.2 ABL016Cp [Eremothecium gossypii ATCC 10895]AEY95044.1 FABL016Cp [Eremothecium gossypii FDAG1]
MRLREASGGSSRRSDERVKSFLPSVEESYKPDVSKAELYQSLLKVVLLEYINEPRFRRQYQRLNDVETGELFPRERQPVRSRDDRKRATWFWPNGELESTEGNALKKVRPILEGRLSDIAIGKYKIRSDFLRRSLLKLYNDLYLDPNMSNLLENMGRFEELIMLFAKAASGEMMKLDVEDTQKELYQQVSQFIDILIDLLARCEVSTPEFVSKLRSYTDSFKPEDGEGSIRSRSSQGVPAVGGNCIEVTVKPAFTVSEISHSVYIMELFGVDEKQFMADVLHLKDGIKNDYYQYELDAIKHSIKSNGGFTADDFPTKELYEQWKEYELHAIDDLINRLEENKARHNESLSKKAGVKVIPANSRGMLVKLLCILLEREQPSQTSPLSSDAQFLISKCARYWRLDYFSTRVSLFYTAYNLTLLDDGEMLKDDIEHLVQAAQSKGAQVSDTEFNSTNWNAVDRHQWLINLNHTFISCMNVLHLMLSGIYSKPKPKFSPVLNIYYNYVKTDPLMIQYNFPETDFYGKWMKQLKRCLTHTSEDYYASLVKQAKKEPFGMYSIQDIAEGIVQQLKIIQKRYPKPLLDEINITRTCAVVTIQKFLADLPEFINDAEQNALAENTEVLPAVALEAYRAIQELKDIWVQLKPKDLSFNTAVHDPFYKYLERLCADTCVRVHEVIHNSLKEETWEPIDESHHYSSSVLDIFKMMNESVQIFEKLQWENEYEIAKTKTRLLKSFSDGLCQYAAKVLAIIEEDLSQADSALHSDDNSYENLITLQGTAERMKNTWLFNEMRNALMPALAEPPETYEFKQRTCVCLNNLSEMMQKINDLEETVNAEKISDTISKHQVKVEDKKDRSDKAVPQLYTIRIVKAENILSFNSDGSSNSAVTLVDTSVQREIAKTKVVRKTVNPMWDELFELVVPAGEARMISATVWHHSAKINPVSSYKVCGKCSLLLDPTVYRSDGYPQETNLDLDTQGRLILQVSLESERFDAMFCVGRAHRALSRACDRAIGLMVSKFTAFVNFSLSRAALKTVVSSTTASAPGGAGTKTNVVYDAILPLFDYLNSNLAILATELTRSLLHKVMLQAWNTILHSADALLLPNLSCARSRKKVMSSKSMTLWENAMSMAKGDSSDSAAAAATIPGFGSALTPREIDVVFDWLRALCVDFFHNGGEGPPLHDLKNQHYQNLLLVPVFYDKAADELQAEVERLMPFYEQYLDRRNYFDFGRHTASRPALPKGSLARKDSVWAHSSRRKRAQVAAAVRQLEHDPLEVAAVTQDILLRILLLRGRAAYVQDTLSRRAELAKAIATRKLVRAAVQGRGAPLRKPDRT